MDNKQDQQKQPQKPGTEVKKDEGQELKKNQGVSEQQQRPQRDEQQVNSAKDKSEERR